MRDETFLSVLMYYHNIRECLVEPIRHQRIMNLQTHSLVLKCFTTGMLCSIPVMVIKQDTEVFRLVEGMDRVANHWCIIARATSNTALVIIQLGRHE